MVNPNIAICGNCGAIFKSAIRLEGSFQNIKLSDNFQSCPNCMSMTRLPEGVFSSVKATIDTLSKEESSIESLQPFISILKKIQDGEEISRADLKEKIQDAGILNAEEVANTSPDESMDKKMWATTLIGVIAYAFNKVPEGALAWIEFIERMKELLGP